jgi:hypothetical protein
MLVSQPVCLMVAKWLCRPCRRWMTLLISIRAMQKSRQGYIHRIFLSISNGSSKGFVAIEGQFAGAISMVDRLGGMYRRSVLTERFSATNISGPILKPRPGRKISIQGVDGLAWVWTGSSLLLHTLTTSSSVALQLKENLARTMDRLVFQHENSIYSIHILVSKGHRKSRDELLF